MAARSHVLACDLLPAPTTLQESAKRAAARRAVDEHVRTGMAIGVGSGSTIVYAIQRLAERAQDANEALSVRCVPTSFQARQVRRVAAAALGARACAPASSKPARNDAHPTRPPHLQLCAAAGLRLCDLSECPELDVAIDGADEVELPSLDCVKGGGACHTLEKVVAASARRFVVVADARKRSRALLTTWRAGVAVEVLALALEPVTRALVALGGVPKLRMGGAAKAGPVVTDNGHLVLDVDFGAGAGLPRPAADLHAAIKALPGVLETGLFPGMAHAAYFGEDDGSVTLVLKGGAAA